LPSTNTSTIFESDAPTVCEFRKMNQKSAIKNMDRKTAIGIKYGWYFSLVCHSRFNRR
jgi:hypothetical protein